MTEEQKEDIKLLKELIADTSIPNDDREIYQDALNQILEQTKSDIPKEAKEKMPIKAKATPKTKASKKPKAEKTTPLPSDVDAMKKAIKERTGKTEAECEDIIAQYRKLRAKAKVNNAKRTEKLKTDDKLITGTNVITPVAQIEKDAEIVKAKIEKQVEQIENKAEREVVKKDKTKDEVKVEVEKKVVKQLAKLSDEMVSSATTFVKNIQTELKKVDKTEAKNFLLGLRNEIDALLSKFGDGGMTQIYNIAEMNSSSSSVNPSKFARGGGVDKFEVGENAHLSTGEKNKMYLDSLRMSYKQAILENISKSYGGISIEQVENEIYDNDAEMLYEYITNNDNLRKRVYGEQSTIYSNFKRGGGVTENDYVVNVGNIGNISCDSLLEARMMYNEYVEQSKSGFGRAGNEYVGLYENGEPIMEYFGTIDEEEYARGGGVRIGSDGREYPFGSAWALEHNKNNKNENYEIPLSSRKS